ncbi:unnamed protein product [Clonostachys chloroleuca]|uniref:Amino acid permease/ SLC12A domain-containing protein n=1 Tax=Clonostachys chloroleuca TaxID=1926264 RepID=A0AA35LWP4_9HYPO|nr:unnamed protein product [Clonostachys chloroleuca]
MAQQNPNSDINMPASPTPAIDEKEGLSRVVSHGSEKIGQITRTEDVGSGLFIATGKALAAGGPGTMFIAYLIVCTGVWANLQSLGEMTIAFPVSGNFIDYAGRWVDPALAFGAGFAEWLGWTSVFAAEAVFFVVLVDYWAKGVVPHAALLSIFNVICLIVFFMPNKFFGWLQAFGSMVKIVLFFFIIGLSTALIAGAGPTGQKLDGSSWRDGKGFQNGFTGFANCAMMAIWAVGDQVFIGVMAGEASMPRISMAHSSTFVPIRVAVMYLVCVVFIGIIVPSDDLNLLGGSGAAASPFVIAAQNAGLKGIPDLVNTCIIIGIVAIALESIYLPSRVLRTMSLQGLLPARIANVDALGRPRWALSITSVVGVFFAYLSLNEGGNEALNWFIAITSASFFSNWAIIGYSNLRFRQALKAQNDHLLDEEYGWKAAMGIFTPIYLIIVSTLLLVCLLYLAISPSGGSFTAANFFQYTIGLLLIIVFSLAYKVIRRTNWVDPATADLTTGRNVLRVKEINYLDGYTRLPAWRRALLSLGLSPAGGPKSE